MSLTAYDTEGFYDEMFQSPGLSRPGAKLLSDILSSLPPGEFKQRQSIAEAALLNLGITFSVYGSEEGLEKIWPFDIIPRIVMPDEWELIERGLKQRITALNLFLQDVYGAQRSLREGVIPADLVLGNSNFRPQCMGIKPPLGVWCHIAGIDLVRHGDGKYYVLEDNLRCPSGVSYVLENRQVLKRAFPGVWQSYSVRPVNDYPSRLRAMLESLAPGTEKRPRVAVLTPGVHNSVYYEHSFLARQMGAELVEGRDLSVRDGWVCMRSTRGYERVDVIYRRVDDDFLDPLSFRDDSMLGLPGLMEAYAKGRVALANAPGTGVADDKAVYAYVPALIRFFMGEEPVLSNVETYLCRKPEDLAYVLEHLEALVVKPVGASGGYGMLVGPKSSRAEVEAFRVKLKADPSNYIAQPTLALSRVPTLVDGELQGRHVDLRPFVLCGKETYVLPGGLTRVALKKGSLVVNSSQGGGSKDTWVLRHQAAQAQQ